MSSTAGDRVTRVRGTFIEDLTGTVSYVEPSSKGEPYALVALDVAEPGIGHQFYCPVAHLELVPS